MTRIPSASKLVGVVVLAATFPASRGDASFHVMQIEQIIGGVNGDVTAQAIQLRMLTGGQNQLQQASLRAVDAAGGNEVLLDNMDSPVLSSASGSRVLITTPNFGNYTDVPLVSDFTMEPIPASYLAAGQVTFDNNSGTITYWSLSWGGEGFTGSTTGNSLNDDDGDFGPPVDFSLPTETLSALVFLGNANGRSTTNLADYGVTLGATTFTNNAGNEFTLFEPAADSADFDEDDLVAGDDFITWQRNTGGPGGLAQGDANNSGNVDGDDLAVWQSQYGTAGSVAATAVAPEPHAVALASLCCGLLACRRLRSR